ncbi:MAG: GTP-dependent dephospho-CoA kinase family protein [Thermoplasmatota archaeon]
MWILPETLRSELAAPWAPPLATAAAVSALKDAKAIASVGDVVTEMLLDHGIHPQLMVVDYRTAREAPAFTSLREKIEKAGYYRERFENAAGTISQVMWDAVRLAWMRPSPTVLEIHGEEDLATLPVVTFAPEGARVLYGQPRQGVVIIPVNEAARARARGFLDRMEKR